MSRHDMPDNGRCKNLHGKVGKLDKLSVDFANFAKFVMRFFYTLCLVLKYVDTKKGVVMDKRLKKFTIADRLAILHEYETSDLTGAEIAQKYGLNSGSTISTWKRRLYNSKKSSTFAGENKRSRAMEDAERQQLLAQITGLQRQLEKSEMEKLALNTLIDIAEEQGIQIRKKSGAKQ